MRVWMMILTRSSLVSSLSVVLSFIYATSWLAMPIIYHERAVASQGMPILIYMTTLRIGSLLIQLEVLDRNVKSSPIL